MPTKPSASSKKEPSPWVLVGSGLELAAMVLIFAWVGHWLDGKWGIEPWLTLTGAALGIIGGMVHLWQVGSRFFR